MRILLTRPEPGAGRTAARLRERGHAVIAAPMLVIAPHAAPAPEGRFDALVFTSPNGVRQLDRARLPAGADARVFAVGGRTADAARAAGFGGVIEGGGDAAALARRLTTDLQTGNLPPGARLLHAAGTERAADLAALTAPAGLFVAVWEVYRAVPAPALPPEAAQALDSGRIEAALHFSPRTARILLARVIAAGLQEPFTRVRHFCLSAAVATCLSPHGIAPLVAPRPQEEAMLALLDGTRGPGAEVAPSGLPV